MTDQSGACESRLCRAERERDRFRELLVEFRSHRADSSVAWIDDWCRRVDAAVDSLAFDEEPDRDA